MPHDQRRNNGPETSVAYRYHSKINLQTYAEKLTACYDEKTGRRSDGRKPSEARKIFLKSNLISQAKGSAYIELGATKVIVAVYDPREIPKQTGYSVNGELYCDFKFSPFAGVCRRSPQTDVQEKSLALSMKRALESVVCRHEFPNFQVDIFANVLQDDGSALSAAITAAGLALADAGIPLYDVITATTVGCIGDRLLLDPTAAEEDVCGNGVDPSVEHGVVMMARLSTLDQVSELWQTGSLHLDTMRDAMDLLVRTNKEVVPIVQQLLVRKVLNQVDVAKRTEALSLAEAGESDKMAE